jgi:hypothetical protein
MHGKHKLKQVAAACALAFAGAAQAQFAAPDITVFLSGASAPQNTLGAIASGLFQGTQGTDWWVYYDDQGSPTVFNTSDGANYRAYFGRLKTTAQDPNMPASIANKTVLLVNRAKGGSVYGVNPVAREQQIQWMERSIGNCVSNTSTLTAYNYACGLTGDDTGTNGIVPDFGVSDVEPAMFKFGRNTEWDVVNGQPFAELSTSELAGMTVNGVSALMFGAAVTQNVVTAGLTDIPREIFGGALNAQVANWAKVDSGLFSSSDNMVVCRRFPGSGTQASYNQYFHNWPCGVGSDTADGTLPEVRMYDSAGYGTGTGPCAAYAGNDGSSSSSRICIDASAGFTVIENSSSGNVRSCLSSANAGTTDFDFQDEAGLFHRVVWSGARKAVGTLSLDSKGASGYGTGWNFVNLAGAEPSQANLISLKYPFHYELSMQYATSRYNGLTTEQKAFIDEFIKRSGDPVVLQAISNVNTRDATAALPVNFAFGSHAKVMKGTRFANSCRPVQPQ